MKTTGPSIPESIRDGSFLVIKSSEIIEVGIQYLEKILSDIFICCNHSQLCEPMFLAVRELIQNATKAALKRIIFEDIKINPESEEEYNAGVKIFNRIIHSEEVIPYRMKLSEKKSHYRIRIDYINGALILQVINDFPLFESEEKVIRQKFAFTRSSANLYDFFMRHSDISEGAGMGIALISILLRNSGFSPRNFTIFNNPEGFAVSRIILPIREDYVSPREEFQIKKASEDAGSFRKKIQKGEVILSALPDSVF